MEKKSPVKRVPQLKRIKDYEGTKEILGKSPGRDKWTDDKILGFPSTRLQILTNAEMLKEVKIFFHGISTSMSPRSVASALLLTWNLRSINPVEARVFPKEDVGKEPQDLPISSFEVEGEVYTGLKTDALIESASKFEARRAGAFVAASTLKMFAKSASSWSLAWDNKHIQKRYASFAKKPFPFPDMAISDKEVQVMAEAYRGHQIYLGTLGRILYAIADVKGKRQLKMLFEQHLSCTGLHIIPQFINAKISIGASTGDMLSALDMGQNKPTLLQLKKLIDDSLSKPMSEDNRGTWRFARLFDQSAFTLLQTKFCQDTVAILAHINHISTALPGMSNPLNIVVLRQMGATRMRNNKLTAKNIHHYFTEHKKNSK